MALWELLKRLHPLAPLMPRIEPIDMNIGDVLTAKTVKDILGDNLLHMPKRYKKWIVEDIIEGKSEIYPAKGKTRVRKKVDITRIFLVPFDSDEDHIRIRLWYHS